MSRIIPCNDCMSSIDTSDDEFCFVTPHGFRYDHRSKIALCRVCRVAEGYDVVMSARHVQHDEIVQHPESPRLLEHKPQSQPEPKVSNEFIMET